jgi:hypothetical protein
VYDPRELWGDKDQQAVELSDAALAMAAKAYGRFQWPRKSFPFPDRNG